MTSLSHAVTTAPHAATLPHYTGYGLSDLVWPTGQYKRGQHYDQMIKDPVTTVLAAPMSADGSAEFSIVAAASFVPLPGVNFDYACVCGCCSAWPLS